LDRFARFFSEPLLTKDCTDREINAVDSEFQAGTALHRCGHGVVTLCRDTQFCLHSDERFLGTERICLEIPRGLFGSKSMKRTSNRTFGILDLLSLRFQLALPGDVQQTSLTRCFHFLDIFLVQLSSLLKSAHFNSMAFTCAYCILSYFEILLAAWLRVFYFQNSAAPFWIDSATVHLCVCKFLRSFAFQSELIIPKLTIFGQPLVKFVFDKCTRNIGLQASFCSV
jgi:hypothetical protein